MLGTSDDIKVKMSSMSVVLKKRVNCGCNVRVDFPFPPYECQEEYMRKVVQACENRQNALLESPTGTGKTLCLLCSVLAWRDSYASRNADKIRERTGGGRNVLENYRAWETADCEQTAKDMKDLQDVLPRIFYTSRTHSQIKQVTKELKKTAYRPRATVIGSREQLCVHPVVGKQKGMKQSAMCAQFCANTRNNKRAEKSGMGQTLLVNNSMSFGGGSSGSGSGGSAAGGTCSYYMSVFTKRYQKILGDTSLCDIEELAKVCKENYVCPFWKTREDAKEAALVLCPYNYLLDPVARNALDVPLRNSIVIFDEGHNIDSICESVQGFEISHREIAFLESEILDCIADVEDGGAKHLVHDPEVSGNGDDVDAASAAAKLTKDEMKMLLGLLKQKVVALEKVIEEIPIAEREENGTTTVKVGSIRGQDGEELQNVGYRDLVFPKGGEILDIFERAGITVNEYKALKDACDKVVSIIAMAKSAGGLDVHARSAKHTEKFGKVLTSLFEMEKKFHLQQQEAAGGAGARGLPGTNALLRKAEQESAAGAIDAYRIAKRKMLDENYRVQIVEQVAAPPGRSSEHENQPAAKKRKKNNLGWDLESTTTADDRKPADFRRTLFFWCFTSTPAMQELMDQGVRSVIITSGTLSPLSATKKSLGVPFNVELSNRHVIKQSQVMAQVLSRGPTNRDWLATYQNRQSAQWGDYLNDLGSGLANFAKVCPAGMLIAFSSYAQMEQTLQTWTRTGVRQRVEKTKKIFVEPRRAVELPAIWQEYQKLCEPGQPGAVLCAIARGKLTEGVDFTDRQCRLVAVVGLPFPSLFDQRIVLKQQFLRDTGICGPDEWYQQQALRAINQTVGRVIRHRADFGCVLLCDKRFCKPQFHGALSSWLQGSLRIPPHPDEKGGFGKAFKEVHAFFDRFQNSDDVCATAAEMVGGRLVAGGIVSSATTGGLGLLGGGGYGCAPGTSSTIGQEQQQKIQMAMQEQQARSSYNSAVANINCQNPNREVPPNANAALPQASRGQDDAMGAATGSSAAGGRPPAGDFRAKVEKQDWMTLCKEILDEDDLDELSSDCLPELRKRLNAVLEHAKREGAGFTVSDRPPPAAGTAAPEEDHQGGGKENIRAAVSGAGISVPAKLPPEEDEIIVEKPKPESSAVSKYKEAIQSIRLLLLPAVCAETEEKQLLRKKLVYNFQQFLHPKFRPFWRADCGRWVREKRIGAWAEEIFANNNY
eukprot:g6112.t1